MGGTKGMLAETLSIGVVRPRLVDHREILLL